MLIFYLAFCCTNAHKRACTDDGGADGKAQSSAASAWEALRRFLEGGPGGGPSAARLRAAAADAILAAEPRFRLPAWLLQLFQVCAKYTFSASLPHCLGLSDLIAIWLKPLHTDLHQLHFYTKLYK